MEETPAAAAAKAAITSVPLYWRLTTRRCGCGTTTNGAMRRKGFEGDTGPATLGSTAKAHLLLRVWCNNCRRIADLDPGEQAERYGADLAVPEWASQLICSRCRSRRVDFVVTPRSTGGLGGR